MNNLKIMAVILSLILSGCGNKSDTESEAITNDDISTLDITCEGYTQNSNETDDVNSDTIAPIEDSEIDCPACFGSGLSYKAMQIDFIDRDMIAASEGIDYCPICLGQKRVKKSVASARWIAVMNLNVELAEIQERRRSMKCTLCGGDGKCWQCKGLPRCV